MRRNRGSAARAATVLVAMLAAGSLLVGCTNGSSTSSSSATPTPTIEPTVQPGGPLSVGVTDGLPVNGWDPITAPDSTVRTFGPLVMATLLRPAANGDSPAAGLATSALADSTGTTWTITLRPGLTFADGSPLTAKDVAFGLIQQARQPTLAARFGADAKGSFFVAAVATDATTVTVRLRSPNALLDRMVFAAPEFGCVKNNYGGLTREAYFQRPASCGPYVAPALTADATSMALDRNPDYYAPRQVGPVRIEVTNLDSLAAADTFTTGGGDIAIEPRAIPAAAATAAPSPVAASSPSVTDVAPTGPLLEQSSAAGLVNAIVFRAEPPARDRNLRIALQAALDQAAFVAATAGGTAPTAGMVAPGWPGSEGYAVPPKNPSLARTALSLVPKGARHIYLLVPRSDLEARAEAVLVQRQAAAVGLRVIVEKADPATYASDLAAGGFESAIVTIAPRSAVAAEVTRQWIGTGGFGGGWPVDVPTGSFPAQLSLPSFGPRAQQAAAAFNAAVLDPVLAIPLVARTHRVLVNASQVSGVVVRWDGSLPLDRVVVGASATP